MSDTDLEFYSILMNRRQHIENIFWSRVQTLHAIQAAILAGWFYLYHHDQLIISILMLSLGAILTALLGFITFNDWKDAEVNDKQFHLICDELEIRHTAERPCDLLKSHNIMFMIIGIFFFIDIILAILSPWNLIK